MNTNTFVIKIGEWYYCKWPEANLFLSLDRATKFAHPDNARQEIIDQGLIGASVKQINHVEQEVK